VPSVKLLLKKVLPSGSTVISGETGLYNEVSWIIVVRPTPPGFDGLKGNEFAIIGPNVASGLGVSLSYLLTALAERGVSGIGILGEVSPEVQREAQNKKVLLIQLPLQTNVNNLEASVSQMVNEERQRLYEREREFNHSLMELALAGGGSSEIVQKLRELTGRNLGFIDLNYNPHFPLEPHLAEAFKRRVHQAISKLRSESAIVSTPIVGLDLTPQQACFIGLIRVGKEIKGYLMLLAPEDSLSEVDRLAVRAGILALAVELSRRQAVEDTEARFESDIIEDLLNGNVAESDLEEVTRRLNINLTLPFVCIIAHGINPPPDPVIAIRDISNRFPKSNCYLKENEIAILFSLETIKNVVELRKSGREVFGDLTTIFDGPVTLGIGRSGNGKEGIQNSFKEAKHSLAMGLKLFGEGSITCFGDLGIYRLLFSLKSSGELAAFYKEYLGVLVEYDRKHDGDLIRTLNTYLDCATISETARSIHVHRNTLLYRLSRIQEITGADLEDGATRLSLHVAILAGEVLNLN
jgi:PucR family transcriptional regulator, purine catabolism regulatory protein